ncbi:MAG TPA: CoA transferase [Thermohalobaculum sp.]|nr:CoA transferase [Thermohalobaculum sp.]
MIPLLDGTRVIDLTSVVMGPFATYQLGALGADVIKVEPPGGETVRHIAPARSAGMGAMFLNVNREKRSLCLDLKRPEARAALERVIATADVLIHNIRRPAAARLGLDPETLRPKHPRLIHCAAIGFGKDGPYANNAAYDDVVQGLSGFAGVNIDEHGAPRYVPQIIVDKVSALFIVEGVLAALLHRERTGEALAFEVPMLECAVHFLMAEHLAGQIFDPPLGPPGYRRLLNPYRRPYPTSDGFIGVLPYAEKHWIKFVEVVGRADVAEQPWFLDPVARSERIHELCQVIDEAMPSKTTAEWLELLRAADIPCGPITRLEEMFDEPHLAASGFFRSEQHPTEGPLRTARHPLDFAGLAETPVRHAPNLGEHSREILAEAGLSPAEIAELEAAGALATPDKEPRL